MEHHGISVMPQEYLASGATLDLTVEFINIAKMGEIFTKNFEKEQISTQHSAHYARKCCVYDRHARLDACWRVRLT